MLKSRIGWISVACYFLLCAYYIIYAYNCSGYFCGLAVITPILPWALLDGVIVFNTLVYILFMALNASIVYAIGAGAEKLLRKH